MIKFEEISYNELEPVLTGQTIFVHHDRHYRNYVNNLNQLLKQSGHEDENNATEIVLNIDKFPLEERDDILYNASAVINHELYFNSMSKIGNRKPVKEIKKAIDQKYGSFDAFKKEFILKANKLVGSGYTFLVLDEKNDLQIMNLSNQDSPYSYGYKPIMALDLWEHSYYLDYLNKRNDYINNFFDVVSFDNINENYKTELHR